MIPPVPFSNEILRFLDRHHFGRLTPRAALIDMDGTLYDSMPNHTKAWYRLMTEAGVACTPEEFYLYEGRTGASTINALFQRAFGREATDEEKESLYRLKTEYFRELPPVKPWAGGPCVALFPPCQWAPLFLLWAGGHAGAFSAYRRQRREVPPFRLYPPPPFPPGPGPPAAFRPSAH